MSTETSGRLSGSLPHFLDYDMDALKSAGRAIIRSPSIAKQSWGSGRHKSEYSAVQRVSVKALAGANLAKPRLTWLNRASLDEELTLQPACT